MKYIILCLLLMKQAFAISITTYNAGLAHSYVAKAEIRKEKILKALQSFDSDILCLQEVWTSEDQEDFVEVLKEAYPYSNIPMIEQKYSKKAPACSLGELFGKGAFVRCLFSNCRSVGSDEMPHCILNKCQEPLIKLKTDNSECAQALMATVGKNPFFAMLGLIMPFNHSPLWAYEGSPGVMLLSKLPFKNSRTLDFKDDSTINHRVAAISTIEKDGKQIQVACTHLTANLRSVPYAGPKKNWKEENLFQANMLIKELSKSKDASIITGDFNCSFGDKVNEQELYQSCKLFSQKNYSRILFNPPVCSFCKENPLNKIPADVLIDHIFYTGLVPNRVDRVFDEKFEGEVLSDHYGIRAVFQ